MLKIAIIKRLLHADSKKKYFKNGIWIDQLEVDIELTHISLHQSID